jgi:hypothetical protein
LYRVLPKYFVLVAKRQMAFKLLMSVCCEYPHEKPGCFANYAGEGKMKEAKNFDLKMLEQMSESIHQVTTDYAEVYDSADASERKFIGLFFMLVPWLA